jgi:hypothetical protein
VTRIVTEVNPHAPVILYDKGASLHIDVLRPMAIETGTVLSVDWRLDIAKLSDLRIQGNLDPAALESDPDSVRTETNKILQALGGQPGHVFNLGHGITPQAKLECVEAMVETVQASSRHFEKLKPEISHELAATKARHRHMIALRRFTFASFYPGAGRRVRGFHKIRDCLVMVRPWKKIESTHCHARIPFGRK